MTQRVLWLRMIGVMVAVVLASCSSSSDSSTPIGASTSPAGPEPTTTLPPATTTTTIAPTTTAPTNEVRVGIGFAPPTLNPFAPTAQHETFVVAQALMAGAFELGPDLELLPDLVVELPTIDNGLVTALPGGGGVAVEWIIDSEARWSDGTPVTGHDFLFTFEVMRERFGTAIPPWGSDPLPTLIDGVATDTSARLSFAEVDTRYEQLFPYVVPEHAVAGTDVASEWDDASWPTAGAFVVEDWDRGSGVVRLVRNQQYWRTDDATGEQLPYLDAVEFIGVVSGEPPDYVADFGVDVADLGVTYAFAADADRLLGESIVVATIPGRVWEHLAWQFGDTNPGRDPLLDVPAFRRAIALALSVDEIEVAAAGLLASPGDRALPGAYLPAGADGGWSQYAYDVAAARALLADACTLQARDCDAEPPVVRLTVTKNATLRPRIAEDVARQLEANLGIEVEIVDQDSSVFFGQTLSDGTWDSALWAWLAGTGSAGVVDFLRLFDPDQTEPGTNPYQWGSRGSAADPTRVARYRDLFAEAGKTLDGGRLAEVASEAVQLLADDVVIIPLASRPTVVAWRRIIDGVAPHPDTRYLAWNIDTWRRLDR